jgi:hypothetical protein
MNILDVLNAVKSAVHTALPELRRCEVHGGRFDIAELKRIATQTPAVFVALLGTPEVKAPGTDETDIELTIALYVVTSDKVSLPRVESVINITQALLQLVILNDWGLAKVGEPTNVTSQNLYSGDVDKHGIALWAVSFKQRIRVGTSIYLEDGVLPSQLYINGEMVSV